MAIQYITYVEKCEKRFFPNYRGGGGHGPFWAGGGYAHAMYHIRGKVNQIRCFYSQRLIFLKLVSNIFY